MEVLRKVKKPPRSAKRSGSVAPLYKRNNPTSATIPRAASSPKITYPRKAPGFMTSSPLKC